MIPLSSRISLNIPCSPAVLLLINDFTATPNSSKLKISALKTSDAQPKEEVIRVEMKQLDQLGVLLVPCEIPYGTKKIKTRAIFKKETFQPRRDRALEGEAG